jgi:aminopeptidase N
MQQAGWSPTAGESEDVRALRGTVAASLGATARDPEASANARTFVVQELEQPGTVDPTLLNVAVTVAAKSGDAALYEKYLARTKAATDPEEHYRYMYALASFNDPAIVRRTLDYILSPEVRNQDASFFLVQLFANRDAAPLAWEFVRARWDDLQKKIGQVFGTPFLIRSLGEFCDARRLTEVEQFFTAHKVPDAARTLQQALERISDCSRLAAAQSGKLTEWLKSRAAS